MGCFSSSHSTTASRQPSHQSKQLHTRLIDPMNRHHLDQRRATQATQRPPHPRRANTTGPRYFEQPRRHGVRNPPPPPPPPKLPTVTAASMPHRHAETRPSRFPDTASYEAAVRARKPDHAYRELAQGRAQMASMPGYYDRRRDVGGQTRTAYSSKRVTRYANEQLAGMPGWYGQ